MGLSPLPIAFVHPTFFARKEVFVTDSAGEHALDYFDHDGFFENRANYRTFMFMVDVAPSDRRRLVQYLYCEHFSELHVPAPGDLPLKAVRFVYHFQPEAKSFDFECERR